MVIEDNKISISSYIYYIKVALQGGSCLSHLIHLHLSFIMLFSCLGASCCLSSGVSAAVFVRLAGDLFYLQILSIFFIYNTIKAC